MHGTAVLSSPDARHRQTGRYHPQDRRHLITLKGASRAPLALLALFALAAYPAVLTHALAPAVPADAPAAVMLADARAPAVLAGAPDAIMLADARTPAVTDGTVLAAAPLAVMLADARAPAVLAPAPDAVMLAYARAPAVLALALSLIHISEPTRPY